MNIQNNNTINNYNYSQRISHNPSLQRISHNPSNQNRINLIRNNYSNILNNNTSYENNNTSYENENENKQTKNIIDLPKPILTNIISYLTNTNDYNNLRITNKFFYSFLDVIKKFNNNICIQEIEYNDYKYNNKCFYLNRQLKIENNYFLNMSNKIIKHGRETQYFINGKIKRISNFKNGRKDGLEQIFFDNKIVFKQVYYKNGVKKENEIINNKNGSCNFIISHNYIYQNIKKFKRNQLSFDVILKNNNFHGDCKYYLYGTLRKITPFCDGLLHGVYKNFELHGLTTIFTYENNKKNGIFVKTNYLNDFKIFGNFEDDKLHGLVIIFTKNRMSKTINFDEGNINGKYIEYGENKKEYEFKDSFLNGYINEYSYSNSLKYKIKYINDSFANIFKTYNISGKLDKEYLFMDDDYVVKKYEDNNLLYTLYKINNSYFFVLNNSVSNESSKIKIYDL